MSTLITILIILLIGISAYKNRFAIKRQYLKFKIQQRNRRKTKFDYDDDNQKKTVIMLEKLMRDKDSRLFHVIDTDEYLIENEDIFGMFNSKIATIVNGKYNNSSLLFEMPYNNLREKFNSRVKKDALQSKERFDRKISNINNIINDDINSHLH